MNEFELRRQLRELRQGRKPGRDLWAEIATRIASEQLPASKVPTLRRWSGFGPAMAASGIVAALLLGLANLLPAEMSEEGLRRSPETASMLSRDADGLALEYQAALTSLPPVAVPPELQSTLQLLDSSAEQLQLALRQQPQSLFLLEQLRRVYARRLQLSRPTWLS